MGCGGHDIVFAFAPPVRAGRDLGARDHTGTSDPYCCFTFFEEEKRTDVIDKTLSPIWDSMNVFDFEIQSEYQIAARAPSPPIPGRTPDEAQSEGWRFRLAHLRMLTFTAARRTCGGYATAPFISQAASLNIECKDSDVGMRE